MIGMEYAPKKFPENLPLNTIKIYLAEISIALQYLHSLKIVFCDLKIDNILIGDDNHIRLIDFGLSEQLKSNQALTNICGTPRYLAPEIVLQKSYSFPIDWWSLGIIAYKLLVGCFPFDGVSQTEIFENITSMRPKFPSTFGKVEREFIESLLNKNSFSRLSFDGILSHPFMKGIDFRALEQKQFCFE